MKRKTLPTPPADVQATLDNPDASNSRLDLYRAAMWANELDKPTLSEYCARKGDAVLARLEGRIVDALRHERTCEGLFIRLPDDQRW